MTESTKLWNQVIDPALRGAGSGLLFDIPEWVAKQIDREATEKYIRENEGMYKGGQLAGTVAGAFIPVGGLAAKGVQALAKGAQAGSALAKAGQAAGALQKFGASGNIGTDLAAQVLKGAAGGALESGVRAAAGERDNILGEALTGGAFGGVAAGLGSALKNAIPKSKAAVGWIDEAADDAMEAKANAMGLNSRVVRRQFNRPGISGGVALERIDNELPDIVAIGERRGMLDPVGRDKKVVNWYRDLKKDFDVLEDYAAKNQKNIALSTPPVNEIAEEYLKKYGPTLGAEEDALRKTLDGVIKKIDLNNVPLASVRGVLQNMIEAGFNPKSSLAGEVAGKFAKEIRDNLDDAVRDLLEKQGQSGLLNAYKEWKAYRLFADSEALNKISGLTQKGGGSPTYEKAAVSQLLGGGVLGGALGMQGTDLSDPDKLGENATRILGSSLVGAALPRVTQGLRTQIMGQAAPILGSLAKNEQLADLLPKIGENIAAIGRGAAGKIPTAQAGVDRLRALEDERANPEVNRGRTQFDTALLQGVAQQLFQAGIPPEQIRTLTPRLLESLSPEARIQIALPKDAQKGALEALEMAKALDLIPTIATGSPLERARAQGAIYQAIGKATGGNTELKRAADKEARKILSQPIADSRKRALISDLLASLDPAGYSTYREMGVVK